MNYTDAASTPEYQDEDFKALRRQFYWNFTMKYKEAFVPLAEEGQTMGPKKDKEIWRNVGEHCMVAGSFAELLAEQMKMNEEQIKRVTTAAVLHDWYKKHETLARRQASTVGQIREIIAQKKEEDAKKLSEKGFSQEVISLTGENLPKDVEGPQTDEAKILWYVDAMLSETEPISISSRFKKLLEHPARGKENAEFSASYENIYAMPLYDLQTNLGELIGRHLAESIGFDGDPSLLPLHLKQLLLKKIKQNGRL